MHAGGVIDKHFQKRYAPDTHPGQALEIPEEYFHRALRTLDALAEYCAIRIEALFPKNHDPVSPPVAHFIEEFRSQLSALAQQVDSKAPILITWFEGTFRTRELLEAHFADQSSFNIDETPHRLDKILVGKKRVGERTMQWLVCAEKAVAGPYIAYLEYLSRRGMLEEFAKYNVPKSAAIHSPIEAAGA